MPQKSQTKRKETKSAAIQRLLSRKSGADLSALQKATGWQPHSVRSALSTLRKSGHKIEKLPPKVDSGRPLYRLGAKSEKA